MAARPKPYFWLTIRRCVYVYCASEVIGQHLGEFILCSGPSMHPTIHDGDVFVAERLSVKLANLHRGDIVGARSPIDNILMCKRLTHKELDPIYDCELLPRGRIPRGHGFLQGDNAALSIDSRKFGPVPMGLVENRFVLRIWPLNRFGWFSNHWFWEKENPTISGVP